MGWFDFLFPRTHQSDGIGPTDLPRDVLDDLLQQDNKNNKHDIRPRRPFTDDINRENSGDDFSFGNDIHRMFQEMDEMMKNLFHFQPNFKIEFEDPREVERNDEESLREKMFESPSQRGSNQFGYFGHRTPAAEDTDLDEHYDSNQHSLDDILNEQPPSSSPSPPSLFEHHLFGNHKENQEESFRMFGGLSPFSFFSQGGFLPETEHNDCSTAFKYSTIRKKVNSDGVCLFISIYDDPKEKDKFQGVNVKVQSIETHTTRRDSDGNEEVSVSRSVGDQTHVVINKKNINGDEEKTENLINMQPDDLAKFEERWKEKKQKEPRDHLLQPSVSSPPTFSRDDSWFETLSSWWKPKL